MGHNLEVPSTKYVNSRLHMHNYAMADRNKNENQWKTRQFNLFSQQFLSSTCFTAIYHAKAPRDLSQKQFLKKNNNSCCT